MLDPLLSTPDVPSAPLRPARKLLTPSLDHPDDYVMELDYSHGISSFLECPRRWQNMNLFSREAVRPPHALSFGGLFHRCEELRLRYGHNEEVFSRQRELVSEHYRTTPVPPDEYRNAERMLHTLNLYNQMYSADQWPQRMYIHEGDKVVERAYKVKLCTIPVNDWLVYEPTQLVADIEHTEVRWALNVEGKRQFFVRSIHVLLTGRIDALLSEGSFLWLVDHKTSSRGGNEFSNAFRLSLQTRGYCWAVQKLLGIKVTGLLLNAIIIRKPTRTGNATEFRRDNFFYSQELLDEYEANVKATASDIVANLQRGFFPQASRSFMSPCSFCDFSENCTLPPHQRAADLRSSLYTDRVWDPTAEQS